MVSLRDDFNRYISEGNSLIVNCQLSIVNFLGILPEKGKEAFFYVHCRYVSSR